MRAPWIIVGLLIIASPVAADDRATAEKHFRTGERLFGAGDFVHAARSFEQAFATLPLPAIAFSAAQSYRLAWAKAKDDDKDVAHLRRAVELYRIYVEKEPRGDRVVEASAALGDLEPLVARLGGGGAQPFVVPKVTGLTITSAIAGVQVAVDGGAPQPLPLVKELPVGQHTVVASAPGYGERTIQAATLDGALVPIEIELDPLPATVRIAIERGSSVTIDGRRVDGDPGRGLAVPAGKHFVAVTRRGRRAFSQEFEVGRGDTLALTARQPVTNQRRISTWMLYGAGALAVGAGTAATLAFLSDADAAALEERRADRGLSIDEVARYETLRAERDDRRAWAIGLGSAAVAVGAAGFLLFYFDRDLPASAPAIAPTVTAEGGAVTWSGTF